MASAMHDTGTVTAETADGPVDISSEFPRLAGLDGHSFDEQIAAYRSVLDQLKAELDGLRVES
ncbi:hypothetical protein [Bifidobacterium vansinderenii]|uniref:Uncharacterized protein n=1 Tax=Bifidobacterium vansinderenii TaxID=1984871 RepID=A0A229VUY4_9BIFI|nr:hypothetical protein [Bifidobacterium vansinderenii]OXM99432.1 hypothetical protein Tam10B_2179 [Bifidobacterium vansinderenii]